MYNIIYIYLRNNNSNRRQRRRLRPFGAPKVTLPEVEGNAAEGGCFASIYIYEYIGGVSTSHPLESNVCHNTYRAIAVVIADSTFANGGQLSQENYKSSNSRVGNFHHFIFALFPSIQIYF